MRSPVCDGRCLRAKVCTKCLNKRRTQADQRSARADKREKQAAAAVRATHLEIQAKEEQANVAADDSETEEEEELFDTWAPGRIVATPERPAFSPTPPSTVRG